MTCLRCSQVRKICNSTKQMLLVADQEVSNFREQLQRVQPDADGSVINQTIVVAGVEVLTPTSHFLH